MPNRDANNVGKIVLRKGGGIYDTDGNVLFSFDEDMTVVDLTTTGNTILGDSSSDSLTVNAKITGQLYWNDSASATKTIKAHNHDSTSTINAEFKYDTAITSGATYGIWCDNNIGATGTASATAILGVATVESGVTVTGGTIIGTYGQARANGTVAGASFLAGLYGLIEASAAITATHVTSCWLDSHQANAVTGQHDLLYMTNNGAAVMDQAIYLYGGNKISNLFELNTVSGMTDASNGGGSDVYINFTIDGVAARLTAKYVA